MGWPEAQGGRLPQSRESEVQTDQVAYYGQSDVSQGIRAGAEDEGQT